MRMSRFVSTVFISLAVAAPAFAEDLVFSLTNDS